MKSEYERRDLGRQIFWGIFLILLSAVFYTFHYLIFRDLHHIFIYLMGDVAFVFLEVLLVTLVIHKLLERRETLSRLRKLNVVIGIFFSEIGAQLIRTLLTLDSSISRGKSCVLVCESLSGDDFEKAEKWLADYEYIPVIEPSNFEQIRDLLLSRRGFLLGLMGNPNLLEHESFTEMLRSVFHVTEELELRPTLVGLPDADYEHLAKDIKRVYSRLVPQWLEYMKHLKSSYPYLFSLAMRMNPFDEAASPVFRGEATR